MNVEIVETWNYVVNNTCKKLQHVPYNQFRLLLQIVIMKIHCWVCNDFKIHLLNNAQGSSFLIDILKV
jgi:hypothetical protein